MYFSSSQEAEFFDTPKEILENEKAGQEDGSIDSPHSDSMSTFRPVSSEEESESGGTSTYNSALSTFYREVVCYGKGAYGRRQ